MSGKRKVNRVPIGKKELRLIAILCAIAYAFIFYKFIWQSVIPSIRTTKADISTALGKLELLEEDYANLDSYKGKLASQKTSSERIDEYLMSSANMVDSLAYVDKLTRLIGDNVKEMNIGRPEPKYVLNGKNPAADETELKEEAEKNRTYYEIKLNFRAFMTYSSAMELVKYIENGTRKIKITKFFIKSVPENELIMITEANKKQSLDRTGTDANNAQTATAQNTRSNAAAQVGAVQAVQGAFANSTIESIAKGEKLFDTNMTISIYSTNLRASDRMYEYSRHKLNRFIYTNGIFLNDDGGGSDILSTYDAVSILDEEFGSSDIIIKERSYLAAGDNLRIFGVDRDNSVIHSKTAGKTEVNIYMTESTYFIDTYANGKKLNSMSGSLPDKSSITMAVSVDMPDIKENEKIGLNIKITNNSGRNLNISLNDQQKRVSISDRNGNAIYSDSTSEKVKII